MINALIAGDDLENKIAFLIKDIHVNGPVNPVSFEQIAYIKKYHHEIFDKYESKLINIMGLFYKITEPNSLIEEIYSLYADSIEHETGNRFTPVQADAFKMIHEMSYFSFSAPTSSGKSYLFREIIQNTYGDIVIVVPSRALISEYYYEVINQVEKDVLVLQFVEDVNRRNVRRRIFIITPERGGDLFRCSKQFNVELILLDEAQISEEPIRGMKFDSFVRRTDRVFPKAKKVFAHPFVNNPEAQLNKHKFTDNASSKNYDIHAVGKIFVAYNNEKFEYFSPYINCKHVEVNTDIAADVLMQNGTLLVYISKDKIYSGQYIVDFNKYIKLCPKINDPEAQKIIETLRHYIGATKGSDDKKSIFLEMMEIGVVIHHGSMPLKARLMIEKFIKMNFAKICFATSTLNQGINMPFDIVWIDNFHNMTPLILKNLIGRAGRSTKLRNSFDYGYTIVKSANVATFKKRMSDTVKLSDNSSLDNVLDEIQEDQKDIVEAIREDTFDDEYHLTKSQLERLATAGVNVKIKYILNNLIKDGKPITGNDYYALDELSRKKLKETFKDIYTQHLRRKNMTPAETKVLSTAIPIMLWRIQGKSFSEIVSLRHAFLSEKDKKRSILSLLKKGEITSSDAKKQISNIKIRYTPVASQLPNQGLITHTLFPNNTSIDYCDYDMIVYDTYDYLDKVISLSLTDPICASLMLYYIENKDDRALALHNYIRYGTNKNAEIWLMKYGIDAEDVEWLCDHIEHIDSNEIIFKPSIHEQPHDRLDCVSRYL